MFLSETDFVKIVTQTPLVSIDLCILKKNKILLGKRLNSPAKNFFFVPGGRILKSELIKNALQRILRDELGFYIELQDFDSILEMGTYEHIYDENFLGNKNFKTHYIVLPYLIPFEIIKKHNNEKVIDQHSKYEWFNIKTTNKKYKNIHQNTINYLKNPLLKKRIKNNY